MRLTVRLIIIFSILLSIQASFSQTCYKSESYCSEYGVTAFNCRAESYNPHSCQVYGQYTVYVPKSCTSATSYHLENKCNYEQQYLCDTRTAYDTCYYTAYRNYIVTFKKCWHWKYYPFYGRDSSCGIESMVPDYSTAYTIPYNCNPHSESYNCGWRFVNVCKDVKVYDTIDCSYYETKNGLHDSTCYDTRTVCDTATDYDKCLAWQDRQVSYDCTEMKLTAYSISSSNGKVGESLLATFNLSDCTGTINYELYMKNANIKGTANCGLNNIEITPASAGTQTILLKLKDDNTNITKTIGTIIVTNPNGQLESANPFIPAGETFTKNIETGTYDADITNWINQGLGNEDIIKNLMMTVGAIGFALTITQANRIREYLNKIRWTTFLSPFIAVSDFIKGFFLGCDENSSQAGLSGELIGGFFLIGDIRDALISIFSFLGWNKKEFDPTLLTLSSFGILMDFLDRTNIGDGFIAYLKTAWKSLPKAARNNLDDFFKLIKNSDELKHVYDLLKRIPVDKISLFFNSVNELLRKTPLKYLEDIVSLFLKLIKYGDDLTMALLKRCAGWQDAAKITKYFDDFGEEAFEQLTKNHSADEIYEIIIKESDELVDITQINTKLARRLKNLEIYDSFDSIKLMTKKEAKKLGADLATELTEDGKRILYIQEDLYNNVDLLKDYDLLHEHYELNTINLHPTKLEIMNKINSDEMLSQLSGANKQELQEVIYDRLIADNALIKENPEYIKELIDIEDVILNIETYNLVKNTEKLNYELIKLAYYENILGKKVTDIILSESSIKYYQLLKNLMGEYI